MPTPNPVLSRVLGEPARLRETDLLPPDQPHKPYPPAHRVRYNPLIRALIFTAIFVVTALVLGALVGVITAALGWSQGQIMGFVGNWAAVLGITSALFAYWVLGRFWERRRPIHELGGAPRGAAVGVGLGIVFMAVSVGILALLGVYRIEGFNSDYSPWMTILTVGFMAGIVEEILFRGICYRLLEDAFGSWAAIGVSALVFGLIHLGNSNATMQGAIGIALEAGLLFAALYAFTRNLWLVMGLHFAWNVVQGPILGIVVSGSSASGSGFIRSSMVGPEWLSGGVFGVEASAVTIVLLTAVGVWLMVELGRRGLIVQPSWVRKRQLAARVQSADATSVAPKSSPQYSSGSPAVTERA